ncbi:hypothetical protein J3R82DRAFT_10545 [Butyriboletus roseoflavus]|nr:hypothetical protein J3R82DRAFT_10545 [Butyriboletus roseoflavus]
MINPKITQVFDKPKKPNNIGEGRYRNSDTQVPRQKMSRPTATPNSRITPMTPNQPPFNCFGCGSHQHTLRNYNPIQDLVRRGELVYNQRGQLGIPGYDYLLRREGAETLLDVYY